MKSNGFEHRIEKLMSRVLEGGRERTQGLEGISAEGDTGLSTRNRQV